MGRATFFTGGSQRGTVVGPHIPRPASHELTYMPYPGHPIPQRSNATGQDSVDHRTRPHRDLSYAHNSYYHWTED
ncbi:hypothetical protein LINPERHAP2_LOCUS9240 [Linum perenne]